MKRIKQFGLFVLSGIVLISCNKNGTALLSTKDHIAGSWQLAQQGLDVNGNYKFDAGEKNIVPDSAAITMQFIGDGRGFRVGVNNVSVDSLKWSLLNNETILNIEINDKGFINTQMFKFEYTSSTLLLRDTSVVPNYFKLYQRKG
jgi:hypothetical protein